MVVAVIAILAALILTGLPGARERARRATCKSNLRQITIAAHLYGVDNRDRVPEGQDPVRRIDYLPLVYTNGVRGLATYGGSSNILDCPNLHLLFTRSNDWRWPHTRNALQLGYLYQGGRQQTLWEGQGDPVTNSWNSPVRLSDDPQWVVASDITYAAPCVKRIVIAHGRAGPVPLQSKLTTIDLTGFVRETTRNLAGGHTARLDGSAEWSSARVMRWYRGAMEGPSDNSTCMAVW